MNESGKRKIAGLEIELLEVSGHAHIQFAVLAGEVLFAADSVFGAGILEKYPLSFMVDIENALQAIETVRYCGAKIIVPGHGEPTTEINALCDTNLRVLKNANQAVLSACYDIGTTPEILARVCAKLEITMTDLTGYVLNQTAVLAHLTNLEERGLICRSIIQNTLVWQAT